MRERYVCIHGHFYQPPRENPWLEAVEIQDSAHPYHDWNERVNAECYAPNSASRILDGNGRVMDIVSIYARISFNFGPTLLSWMETHAPEIYRAILLADEQSREWRSGHGNAIAQVYNHMIMPLACERDKRTQVLWGIRDFERRFRRFPEGMWLAETAVDLETLDILAEAGIRFTILAPHQAGKVMEIGTKKKWRDVSGAGIDPSRAYLCRLPSGREISLFFYDGPISRAVAFEKLLNRGEDFAHRLLSGFSEHRKWPQLLHIATDGETYGHHHKYGDMALAYSLSYIEKNGLARITNYGEYLELHPPTHEVKIVENSSWSCCHGIERWRSNCGCNSGGNGGWNQKWRAPLRSALDNLRDRLSVGFERKAALHLRDPWLARDDYITVILDRCPETVDDFLDRHSLRTLADVDRTRVLSLLEMQRHAMLMYTSCGWFFDEISGIETVQIIQYAGRAIQLAEGLLSGKIEAPFLKRLSSARSNVPDHENGKRIYERFVKPAMIDLVRVAAHYAVSSVFEDYIDETGIFSYRVAREEFLVERSGHTVLAIGKILVRSSITMESELISFSVLYFGNHSVCGGVRPFLGDDAYEAMKVEITGSFVEGEVAEIVRLMDRHFGMHNYSIRDLFRDEQRKIMELIIDKTLTGFDRQYMELYGESRGLMGFLRDTGMPMPEKFITTAEIALNLELRRAFSMEEVDLESAERTVREVRRWNLQLDSIDLEFCVRRKIERMMEALRENPGNCRLLARLVGIIDFVAVIPLDLNYWKAQNIWFEMLKTDYPCLCAEPCADGDISGTWGEEFVRLGERLGFNTAAVITSE
jgi:alpha-amylase/alpha-mannosidase (GH57 family)